MERRGFLAAMLAAAAAPAVVRAGVLMPVRKIWVPPAEILLPHAQPGSLFMATADYLAFQGKTFMALRAGVIRPGQTLQSCLDGPEPLLIQIATA